MTLKFALAGAGYIANVHAQAIKAQKDAELVAVVEKFPDKAAEFAGKFGLKRRYETVADLLEAGGVDALVIGTPNALHAPQAIAALEAGVHVLVEKPMAMNAGEAQKMVEAGAQSGAALMVAHCWRFDEDVLWLKKQSAKLGKIIRTKGYGVHVNWGPAGWFTQKALAGGGALADMGIHALDTARFLLGDPPPVSVYAKIGAYYKNYWRTKPMGRQFNCRPNRLSSHHFGALTKNFDVDDTGTILVEWDNGAVSYIESGWWQPHTDGPEAATQLYGTKGFGQLFPTFIKDEGGRVKEAGTPFPRAEHCPQGMYDAQMAYFVKCIKSGQAPVPGGAEGLVNMKVVDAAYKSASSGKVEKI